MKEQIFDIENFNIVQDENNYYLFRALNNGDYNDIQNGITQNNGELSLIRTDLDRYEEEPIYRKDDEISLEEVHDHVKWCHRKDTNCISLTMNANVASIYGKENYHDQYLMVTVPKNKLKENNLYIVGPFVLEEIEKRIYKIIENGNVTQEKRECIEKIEKAESTKKLIEIIEEYTKSSGNIINTNKYYDYLNLNEKQNLEKNKVIAKLDILNRRLINRFSNRLLIETIKLGFDSTEVLHYKEITQNFTMIPSVALDLIALVQQVYGKIDDNVLKFIEKKVIEFAKTGDIKDEKLLNISALSEPSSDLSISDIYNMTDGKISFYKAYKALMFSKKLCNSKIKNHQLCILLKQIVGNSKYDTYIDDIEKKSFAIVPSLMSVYLNDGYEINGSVHLNINSKLKKNFSSHEESSIINYINSLTVEQQIDFLKSDDIEDEKIICGLLDTNNANINMNDFYAETIVDFLDLDKIYRNSILNKTLSKNEKEILINYLKKANCINMFNSLKNLELSNEDASAIIFNLMLNNKYNGMNFIDLSNSQEFENMMRKDINNLNTNVSALRLDYLLGIRDNQNFIPNSKINLRDYQQLAVDRVDEIYETKNYAGVVLPTGAGKSFVAIAEMLKHSDQNIIYYAPNREILRQLQKHILKYVLGINVISSDDELYYIEHQNEIPENTIFQSGIDDIIKNAFPYLNMYCYQGMLTKEDEFFETRNAGLIILDEVHRTGAQEWNVKIRKLLKNNPNAKILGITATPIRDVDQQNMVKKLAEFSGTYTKEEIQKKEYMAAEMYLMDAMQEGIVVTPNIVTFDYTLEDSERYNEVKRMYEEEKNPLKKEALKNIYDEMRNIIVKSRNKGITQIIKEGFEKNHKPFNGKYIVFLPQNSSDSLSTEEYMLNEIKKIKEYFKDIDPDPEIEYLLSNRKIKSENDKAIDRFERDSKHLKLIFAINMLNEGVHVEGIDGIVMLRSIGAGSKILYHQQIGRCIYSLDPNHELEPEELPIIFDVYNNYLEQNMDRQVNKHTATSDLHHMYAIIEWIDRHYRYPDINSESIEEARKAINLKRIQTKYRKYAIDEKAEFSNNLSNEEIYEINKIIELGNKIDLWDIVFEERIIPPSSNEIQSNLAFKATGEQKQFIELFKEATKITERQEKKSKALRLIDILNVLDVLSEYNFDINNDTIPNTAILKNIYDKLPADILRIIKEEIDLEIGYEIGIEYNEAKKQFYKKNIIFQDYNISTLRKMGIFEPCNIYEGFKNIDIVDEKGFIINGPSKFLDLNIYTGTYYDVKGLDIDGLDEYSFSEKDKLLNKYHFDRDGYYYVCTEDGTWVNTESKYDIYGFDVKGNCWELQSDGSRINLGKLNRDGFDRDKFYYKYNPILKEYSNTGYLVNEKGFNIDRIYCPKTADVENIRLLAKRIIFCDGSYREFENIKYLEDVVKVNGSSRFLTNLPYDINYFDIDGFYYKLDENGQRVKTSMKYNEKYLDADGYYYELQPDGTRQKTDRMYDDNFYSLDGYYYELQPDGTRQKTENKNDKNGFDRNGFKIIRSFTFEKGPIAFDKDGNYYEYDKNKHQFYMVEPATKISRYGFDMEGYYHEMMPDGTRDPKATSKINKYGFDQFGKTDEKDWDKHGFDIEGYYHKKARRLNDSKEIRERELKEKVKVNEHGFDRDGLYEFTRKDGTVVKKKYNNRFLSIDGYYYKGVKQEDGTVKRIKTERRVDSRGFDLDGYHYDVLVNKETGKYVYKNKCIYDKYGFDVNGVYYELPSITYTNGVARRISSNRVKTNPEKHINEYGLNCRGFYCYYENGELIVTEKRVDKKGFNLDGIYLEPDENGNPRIYDKYGFTRDGYFVKIKEDGTTEITQYKYDKYGFRQEDYEKYCSNSNSNKIINGFNCMGNYQEATIVYYVNQNTGLEQEIVRYGKELGPINPNGFDRDEYYHELLPDGTRNPQASSKKTDDRGFDIREVCTYTQYILDENGFDINGMSRIDDEVVPYNPNGFDIEGYYYKYENGQYIKTDHKYNENGFDLEGNYWKEKDGEYYNTNQEYDDDGYNSRGFDKNKVHKVTRLTYDENYFDADGINVITNNKYALDGSNANGIIFNNKKSSYAKTMSKDAIEEECLECVFIAKRALSLKPTEKELVFNYIESDSRDKKVLTKLLYENIIAASVLDKEVKKMLIEYINKANSEIIVLTKLINEEKAKISKNYELIQDYQKKLASYREIIRNTSVGGKK